MVYRQGTHLYVQRRKVRMYITPIQVKLNVKDKDENT